MIHMRDYHNRYLKFNVSFYTKGLYGTYILQFRYFLVPGTFHSNSMVATFQR